MTKYGPIKEFTDDDDGVRRVITDVVFSHEDEVYFARYVIKGEKNIWSVEYIRGFMSWFPKIYKYEEV